MASASARRSQTSIKWFVIAGLVIPGTTAKLISVVSGSEIVLIALFKELTGALVSSSPDNREFLKGSLSVTSKPSKPPTSGIVNLSKPASRTFL